MEYSRLLYCLLINCDSINEKTVSHNLLPTYLNIQFYSTWKYETCYPALFLPANFYTIATKTYRLA